MERERSREELDFLRGERFRRLERDRFVREALRCFLREERDLERLFFRSDLLRCTELAKAVPFVTLGERDRLRRRRRRRVLERLLDLDIKWIELRNAFRGRAENSTNKHEL